MDARELSDLVAHGQVDTLVHRLAPLNEKERKLLVPGVKQMLDYRNRSQYPEWPLAVAVLGTIGGERQVARALENMWNLHVLGDHGVRVLRDRSPHWLPKLPGALLASEARHWNLVRQLVREGVVEMPDEPEYLIWMVWGVVAPNAFQAHQGCAARDGLLADPGLLDRELWLMLATERVGRQLTTTDGSLREFYDTFQKSKIPMPTRTWWHALVTLAAEGRLERGRLLDAALAAPLRDWAPSDVTWFVGLHDALVPTADEVLDRQATYSRLLTCDHGPAVKVAQKCLTPVLADDRLDVDALLSASHATLARSDKASVLAQLSLLKKLVKVRGVTEAAVPAVQVALDHPRPDVRERARALLDDWGVAPPDSAATLEFVAPEPQPLPAPDAVVPVADPDELAELLLRLLEEADDPIAIERCFDGVLRFGGQTSAATTAVLLRRAEESQLWGLDPRRDLAVVAKAWIVRPTWRDRFRKSAGAAVSATFGAGPHEGSLAWFHQARVAELVRLAAARAAVPLALPTHADGSIEAGTLAERLGGLPKGAAAGSLDLAVALLRVPPQDLSEDLVPRSARDGWVTGAIRLLRDWSPEWERVRGESKSRWGYGTPEPLVTFRDRKPSREKAGAVGQVADRSNALAGAGWDRDMGVWETRYEQLVAWWATYFPHHPDLFAAHLHPTMVGDLTHDRGLGVPVLDSLTRRRPGPVESSALVLGLCAKDVRVRTAGQDALLDLAGHGLLDGPELGRQAVAHLADGTVVGQRLSGSLAAAVVDDAAVRPVLETLEVLLPATGGRRDTAAFVELAAELVHRSGRRIAVPPHLVALAESRSSSVAAKAARRLL
ncbi:MAG TPA: DUF6493 family protein [Nocardioidaceae bacterium]|nr:DUF6493 family protein [Nocardioidaceae bacterium]